MTDIYNRFDPAAQAERLDFRADRVLQSAELNELQSIARDRLRKVSDVLFADGDVIRDAGIRVDAANGECRLEAGAIYLQGAVRGIGPATLTVATVGTVVVGVYLQERMVTELEDPTLLNPAIGTRGYGEPGASRVVIDTVWGIHGDGTLGQFSPVYTVDDGVVRLKSPPPNLDAVSQAIARYDRDSTGGVYVVGGLDVSFLATDENDVQTYSIAEGRGYIEGRPVTFQTARRVTYEALPEVQRIASEPHLATASPQRVNVNFPAIAAVQTVQITNEKTVVMTHGAYAGAADALPDASVIEIVSVTQGATTYTAGADYVLGSGTLDWSPMGAEPATGSTYSVTYKWIKTADAETLDATGFTVAGAVPGTLILVTYDTKLPRFDRLCLASTGAVVWVKGVPALKAPFPPAVPANLLPLATVWQTWLDATRTVTADGPRTVSMAELSRMNARIDEIYRRVAEHRLLSDASVRNNGIQTGIFVDPFLDDEQRDAGIAQTAAIVNGELVLAIGCEFVNVSDDIEEATTCARTLVADVAQTQRTGAMRINPYGSQLPPPASITLSPAQDLWTDAVTNWASPVTRRLADDPKFAGNPYYWKVPGEVSSTATETLGVTTKTLTTLRQIPVTVTGAGFGPAEPLARMTFDGIDVTPVVRPVADANGVLVATFTVPANVPAGTKRVILLGGFGGYAEASFVGQGTQQVTQLQQVTTITPNYVVSFTDPNTPTPAAYTDPAPNGDGSENILVQIVRERIAQIQSGACVVDPLAQTFRVSRHCQLGRVQLTVTARGTKPIVVQIRQTSGGFPGSWILAEARWMPEGVVPQLVAFDFPIPAELYPDTEYALVVMSDDQTHQVGIAELGAFDTTNNRWVTAQAYEIGVLLSSANAQTWTAHQDRDLTFTAFRANYTEAQRIVDLGHVTVDGATDLVMLAAMNSLSAAASVDWLLSFPDGSSMAASAFQTISLAAPVTGDIGVQARIRAETDLSGVLYPGSGMVAGQLAAEGDYVSRAIPCHAGDRLQVIYDAVIPPGATVAASYQVNGAGGWTAVTAPTGRAADFGAVEYTSITTGLPEGNVRVKLVLTGAANARPKVRNLRAIVTE